MTLTISTGSPPSPVPPLPERTPESFVLAIDQGDNSQYNTQQLSVNIICRLNMIFIYSCFPFSSCGADVRGHIGSELEQNRNIFGMVWERKAKHCHSE